MEAVALEDLPLAQRLREMARKCVERNDEFEKVKAKTKRQEERQAVEKRRQALRQKHADKLAKQAVLEFHDMPEVKHLIAFGRMIELREKLLQHVVAPLALWGGFSHRTRLVTTGSCVSFATSASQTCGLATAQLGIPQGSISVLSLLSFGTQP